MQEFFLRYLRHSKGQWAGQPFELLPWQWTDVVQPLFGWLRADGTRRFRRAYIEIPKKNGKSTLSSGIALYLLCADQEPGAEIYCAAADREQAGIVFREAANCVESSPQLSARLEVVRSTKRIVYPAKNAYLAALSSEVGTKEGLNIHGLIFDELHAQKSRELWDCLRYGFAARRQPLLVAITTAGYDKHSICWEQHEYARGVLDGTIEDDACFAYIRAADPEDDWADEKTWFKANPSLGDTISLDSFRDDFREAQQSPAQENAFRRYRLNQWTEQDVRWLQLSAWDACPSEPAAPPARECFAGLDLSSTTDLTALALLFPPSAESPLWLARMRFWVPQDSARKREQSDRVPYTQWIRAEHIVATPGNVVDYDRVREDILELAQQHQIARIAIDRWNATQIATQLAGEGLAVEFMGQGFRSLSAPTKQLEQLVLARQLNHQAHPVLRWNVGNLAVEIDAAGNIKPSKKRSTERIDGAVALVMAIALAIATPPASSTELIVL